MANQRRPFLLLAVLATAAPTLLCPRIGRGAEASTPALGKVVALNKEALAKLQAKRFDEAKDTLLHALVVGKDAGLESNEALAYTHIYLGVVFLTGEKSRDKAINQFMLALRIAPAVTIAPALSTPALKSAYLSARRQVGLPPQPEIELPAASAVSPVPESNRLPGAHKRGRATHRGAATNEPDLPARVGQPLYCPLPFEIPPEEPLTVRCLTQKAQTKSTAVLNYRSEGADGGNFTAVPMVRSPKGWLMATLPGEAVTGQTLAYYIEATIPGATDKLYLGRPDAPNHFSVREGAVVEEDIEDDDPLRSIQQSNADAEDTRLFHRRLPGAVFAGVAGGMGFGWHGREYVDSGARNASQLAGGFAFEDAGRIAAPAGFAPASQFHLQFDLGYQISKSFWVSAIARYQRTPRDGRGGQYAGERPVLTRALSAFARAHYAFATLGNFQAYASAGVGAGRAFLLYFPKTCTDATADNGCVLAHSDTVSASGAAVTVGVGALYHLSRWFGVYVDLQEIATFPTFLALSQASVGMAFAYDLFDDAGASSTDDEQSGSEPPRSAPTASRGDE